MSNRPPEKVSPISILGIEIPVAEQSPLVLALVEVIARQQREIDELKDQVHKLKKTTRKPRPKPSKLLAPDKPKPQPGDIPHEFPIVITRQSNAFRICRTATGKPAPVFWTAIGKATG